MTHPIQTSAKHMPMALQVGGKYNWRNQPERLAYVGVRRYPGDPRIWYQFERVLKPGVVWCEVLASDLASFEETEPTTTAKATGSTS